MHFLGNLKRFSAETLLGIFFPKIWNFSGDFLDRPCVGNPAFTTIINENMKTPRYAA
jgi:hypothetical protein